MQQRTVISEAAAKGARQLGITMLADPVIQPHLRQAHQFGDYDHFRIAHRAYWEQCGPFEPYQEKIVALAERDGRRLGLDRRNSVEGWDIWYNRLVHPLKDMLWEMWEKGVALEEKYYDACWMARTRRIAPAVSVRREDAIPIPGPMVVPPESYPSAQAGQAS